MKKNIVFLFIFFIICNNEVSGISQSHKLRNLGYSKYEVELILSNKKTRRQIDYERRLMNSGYHHPNSRLKSRTDPEYKEMKTGPRYYKVKNLSSNKKNKLTKRVSAPQANFKKKLQQHKQIKPVMPSPRLKKSLPMKKTSWQSVFLLLRRI